MATPEKTDPSLLLRGNQLAESHRDQLGGVSHILFEDSTVGVHVHVHDEVASLEIPDVRPRSWSRRSVALVRRHRGDIYD